MNDSLPRKHLIFVMVIAICSCSRSCLSQETIVDSATRFVKSKLAKLTNEELRACWQDRKEDNWLALRTEMFSRVVDRNPFTIGRFLGQIEGKFDVTLPAWWASAFSKMPSISVGLGDSRDWISAYDYDNELELYIRKNQSVEEKDGDFSIEIDNMVIPLRHMRRDGKRIKVPFEDDANYVDAVSAMTSSDKSVFVCYWTQIGGMLVTKLKNDGALEWHKRLRVQINLDEITLGPVHECFEPLLNEESLLVFGTQNFDFFVYVIDQRTGKVQSYINSQMWDKDGEKSK